MVMLGPFGLQGEANRYFENLGAGRFRDATAASGLEDEGLFYSFAVVALDVDDDLDVDLYVANDSNPNYLYRNDGAGHFQETGHPIVRSREPGETWRWCWVDEVEP